MAKRVNGEGSIYYRKDRDSWRAEILLPLPDGTHKRIRADGKTRSIALKRRKAKEKEILSSYLATSKSTVTDTIVQCLKTKSTRVSNATLAIYKDNAKRYIIPTIGDIKISLLTTQHVEMVLEPILKAKYYARADQCRRTLSTILNWAVKNRLIEHNPAKHVEPIKVPKTPRVIWKPQEVAAFLEAANASWYYPLFQTAILTGLRKGELQALTWSDVVNDALTVNKTYSKHGKEIKAPKTASSKRTIPLSGDMLAILAKQRERVQHRPDDFVFPSSKGTMIAENNITRALKRACNKAGVPPIRFHDLRHLSASLVGKAAGDPAIIQAFLGHSDPRTSLTIYRHILQGEKEPMRLSLDDARITPQITPQAKK